MTLGKKNCASDVEGKGEEKSYRSRDSADSCRLTTQKRQGRKGKARGKGKEETKQKKKVPLPPALGLINGLLGKMEVSESRMFFFFFFFLSLAGTGGLLRTSACGNQGTKRWTAAPLVPAPSAKMSTARLDTCRTRAIDG